MLSGEESLLFSANTGSINYSLSHNGIYYLNWSNSGWDLNFYNFSSGKSETVTALGRFRLYGMDVSPNNKYLIYSATIGQDGSDIMLVENFK